VAQISQKIVDLQDFSKRLDKMVREVRRAKLSCDAVRDAKTDVVLLSYVAEFERAEKAFGRISNALEELDDFAQLGELSGAGVDLCDLIEKQFGKDPAWEVIKKEVHQRLLTTSINVISQLAGEIYVCDHTLFSDLPDGTVKYKQPDGRTRREKKSGVLSFLELCGFKGSVTITPKPAVVEVTEEEFKVAMQSLKNVFNGGRVAHPIPPGFTRINAWPIHIRPDLANEMKYVVVPKKDEHKKRRDIGTRFHRVTEHILAFIETNDFVNSRTGKKTVPVLIEELNYLSTSTINALYKADLFTVADLVTLDGDKPLKLRTINRIAASKVLELQLALSEVGIYRRGRSHFKLGKPKNPLKVKDLPASPMTALRPYFMENVFLCNDIDEARPLNELIASSYNLSLSCDETGFPEDWLWDIHGINESDVEWLFGSNEDDVADQLINVKSIDGFGKMSHQALRHATLGADYIPPDVAEYDVDLQEEHMAKAGKLIEFISLFACYKATHAQDSTGMSWYDEQFGHMPWLYDEECDDEEIAKRVKKTRGAYGVPLSWYGNSKFNRTHPDYWWR